MAQTRAADDFATIRARIRNCAASAKGPRTRKGHSFTPGAGSRQQGGSGRDRRGAAEGLALRAVHRTQPPTRWPSALLRSQQQRRTR